MPTKEINNSTSGHDSIKHLHHCKICKFKYVKQLESVPVPVVHSYQIWSVQNTCYLTNLNLSYDAKRKYGLALLNIRNKDKLLHRIPRLNSLHKLTITC